MIGFTLDSMKPIVKWALLFKIYYESKTYLEGKEKVLEGLDKGSFYRKEDGSVWADLTSDGLDHKLLLG